MVRVLPGCSLTTHTHSCAPRAACAPRLQSQRESGRVRKAVSYAEQGSSEEDDFEASDSEDGAGLDAMESSDDDALVLKAKAKAKKAAKAKAKKPTVKRAAAKSAAKKGKRAVEDRYSKMDMRTHVLERPDTYVGSDKMAPGEVWTWQPGVDASAFGGSESTDGRLVRKKLEFVPALLKIFDEILVNALDQKARNAVDTTVMRVNIDRTKGRISIMNNGGCIPVEIHKIWDEYVAVGIFGSLLTSENFDDSEKRLTGGRNGMGAKLTNIFSKRFVVETSDSKRRKYQKVVWKNNMATQLPVEIKPCDRDSSDYVKVTFDPDFARFGMEGIDDDTYSLLMARVVDVAGTSHVLSRKGIAHRATPLRVYVNGKRISVDSFKKYASMCAGMRASALPAEDNGEDTLAGFGDLSATSSTAAATSASAGAPAPPRFVVERFDDRATGISWEIIAALSDDGFQVSFLYVPLHFTRILLTV